MREAAAASRAALVKTALLDGLRTKAKTAAVAQKEAKPTARWNPENQRRETVRYVGGSIAGHGRVEMRDCPASSNPATIDSREEIHMAFTRASHPRISKRRLTLLNDPGRVGDRGDREASEKADGNPTSSVRRRNESTATTPPLKTLNSKSQSETAPRVNATPMHAKRMAATHNTFNLILEKDNCQPAPKDEAKNPLGSVLHRSIRLL